jgi:hypothetical protein
MKCIVELLQSLPFLHSLPVKPGCKYQFVEPRLLQTTARFAGPAFAILRNLYVALLSVGFRSTTVVLGRERSCSI